MYLEEAEVHVWRASLDMLASEVGVLQPTLSPDELARAERFHFEIDRRRFIVARGLLRAILARYVGIPSSQLSFMYGPHGKPRLAEKTGGEWLQFNLSHSDGRALYAVTANREVGIDLERVTSERDHEAIAEYLFTPGEVGALRALPAEKLSETFYRIWTCKEAYVKARGGGLWLPLDRFDVSLIPGKEFELLRLSDTRRDTSHWSLYSFDPWPGYAAALAVEGMDIRVSCWQWPDC